MLYKDYYKWAEFETLHEGFKSFSRSIQLIKCFMLIDIKMPTIVGILTIISMVNTTSESLKASIVFIFPHNSYYKQLKFHIQMSQMSWAGKIHVI